MKLEIAKAIIEAAQYLEIEGVGIHESYSGRGMYGKSTTAISVDNKGDINRLIVYVGYKFGGGDIKGLDDVEIEDFVKEFDFRQDSYGHGIIVY